MSRNTKPQVSESFSRDFVLIPKNIQKEAVIRMLGASVIANRFFMTSDLTDYFEGLTSYALMLLGYSWSGENSELNNALTMAVVNLAREIDLFDSPRTEDLGRKVLKKWEKEIVKSKKKPENYQD